MDTPSLMAIDPQRAQTLSAVSTVFSAFLVFVIGGGLVLKIWTDERKATQSETAAEITVIENAKPEASKEVAQPTEKVQTKTRAKPKSSRSKPAERSAAQAVKATKKTKASSKVSASSPASETVSGKGQVVIAGDARVRLVGSNGTFGSGTVPAGSYTIQATFEGGDPRMAGTVKVANGERIIIICKTAGQRCVQR